MNVYDVYSLTMSLHRSTKERRIIIMAKFGLMTDAEVVSANNFNVVEETNVDAMAWSWVYAGRVALAVAACFL